MNTAANELPPQASFFPQHASGQEPEPPQPISVLPASPPSSKPFPFMLVTFLLFVIVASFAGSFLFFGRNMSGGKKKAATIPIVTLPVSPIVVSPTPANPFSSPTPAVLNPFASATPTYANPFGETQNPFSPVVTQTQSGNQPYQNPFASP